MLSEEQLEIISEAITPLFQYLEKEVITDIARRIAKTLTYSRTAELQAMSMADLGYSPARIRKEAMKILNADPEYRKAVAKNTLEYKREIRNTINDITREAYKANDDIVAGAGNMAWISDLAVWKSVGKELKDHSFLQQLVDAFAAQTAGELKNMTQSTGFKTMSGYEGIENAYRRELDKAVIKICSGTFSQDKVIRDVVHDLAQSGLRSIDYASGYSMQLDTASRLAIRTGCHQLAGKIQDKNIEQTGENLVYVSKHRGARNKGIGHANHEQWQGRVYYIKEGQDYREEADRIGQDSNTDLWRATGYSADGAHEDDPEGLYGYNCRHNHYAWFEGASSFPKNHDEKDPAPVTINGKTYDYYAMTQKMRSMERNIRALKREKEALTTLGADTTEINARIKSKTAEYKEFCKACGVPVATSKLRYECGTSDLKNTKAWKGMQNIEGENGYKEYRVIGDNGKAVSLGEKVTLSTMIAKMPSTVRSALSDVTFHFNSSVGGGYWYGHNEIYLPSNVTDREFYHEVGHCLEEKLFNKKEVDALKKNLVQGLTKDDIIIKTGMDSTGNTMKIFVLNSPRFIKEYQGRLYVESVKEALNSDGSINTDALGEVVSVAVEHYFMTPRATKKYFPDMYRIVEETLHE